MNYAELIAKHGMPEARRLWKEAQKAATRERERKRLAGRTAEKSRDALARYNARQFVAWDGEGLIYELGEQLAASERPVADLALLAGYSDQNALTRAMRRVLGQTPAAYRRHIREAGPRLR